MIVSSAYSNIKVANKFQKGKLQNSFGHVSETFYVQLTHVGIKYFFLIIKMVN